MTGKEKKSTNTQKPDKKAFKSSKIKYKAVQNNSPFRNSKIKTREVSDFQSNDERRG
ncbi:hypothetical protein LCGC14_0663690 [marine sediment metagenome]|uniref:Uncharacterized protein n=1 Tax=marine sediment metagenome TaxID=412755 RepID=A0A0F9TEA2_9ZZZZ